MSGSRPSRRRVEKNSRRVEDLVVAMFREIRAVSPSLSERRKRDAMSRREEGMNHDEEV